MKERPAPTPHADQEVVVMVYTSSPMDVVAESIQRIRENGGEVHLLGPQVRGYEKPAEAANSYMFLRQLAQPVPVDPNNRPRKYSLPWASIVSRNLTRKFVMKHVTRTLGASTTWWVAAAQSKPALDLLRKATVLTALDAGAIFVVWNAARRNHRAAAINGLGPTMEHLDLVRH